jgi:hypothetical protein
MGTSRKRIRWAVLAACLLLAASCRPAQRADSGGAAPPGPPPEGKAQVTFHCTRASGEFTEPLRFLLTVETADGIIFDQEFILKDIHVHHVARHVATSLLAKGVATRLSKKATDPQSGTFFLEGLRKLGGRFLGESEDVRIYLTAEHVDLSEFFPGDSRVTK